MSKNNIDYKKIDSLKQEITFAKENILSNIEQLKSQIEILSEGYNDSTSKEIYNIIINQKLISLKQSCNKMDKMNEILNNVSLAYKDLEDRILSIVDKENG